MPFALIIVLYENRTEDSSQKFDNEVALLSQIKQWNKCKVPYSTCTKKIGKSDRLSANKL